MRVFGYLLLFVGFVWVEYVPVSVGPLLRSMETNYRREQVSVPGQETPSLNAKLTAFLQGGEQFARFTQLGGIGGVIMVAGGILVGVAARRRAAVSQRPVANKAP